MVSPSLHGIANIESSARAVRATWPSAHASGTPHAPATTAARAQVLTELHREGRWDRLRLACIARHVHAEARLDEQEELRVLARLGQLEQVGLVVDVVNLEWEI